MKIAIISDIHGNLEALKATLKNIEKRKVDKIICLGDIIAKGVHPKECISLIRTNCEIVLQGNCDVHFSTEHKNIDEMNEQEQKRIKWNQSLINKEDINKFAFDFSVQINFSYNPSISFSSKYGYNEISLFKYGKITPTRCSFLSQASNISSLL